MRFRSAGVADVVVSRRGDFTAMPDLESPRAENCGGSTRLACRPRNPQSRLVTDRGRRGSEHFCGAAVFSGLRCAADRETRVLPIQNTWNGDFLIDLNPEIENVWLVAVDLGRNLSTGPLWRVVRKGFCQ